ncbi:MAG TPA: TIGR01777 family oxidoreductase [Bryobacteraceae bacterium]|nr:TIGR01777 family protein [Bryobacterales bacterium]HRJ20016.1 TIGR01777 family oxidoreductase [Bryobacteraceae bacterium]
MRVALTGARGFVGSALTELLQNQGHETKALSRWPSPADLEGVEAVVHLAGEPVAQRWTAEAKRRIRDSRVLGTRHLVESIKSLEIKPKVVLCASATGFYGHRGDEVLTEESGAGEGFLAETCREWENEAKLLETLGVRVVFVRIGIVLGRGGGALAKMLPPFRLGVGGRLSHGKQWMSWIHREDLARLMAWALEKEELRGVVNGTAPGAVTNAQFTRVLARVLRRPAVFPVPEFVLKLAFGEMARVLLESQRVKPEVAEEKGFVFKYPDLEPALRELLGG